MREALQYLPDAIEALGSLFRVLRSREDAQSVVSYLRGLEQAHRADIDAVKREIIAEGRARHTDGTGGSD